MEMNFKPHFRAQFNWKIASKKWLVLCEFRLNTSTILQSTYFPIHFEDHLDEVPDLHSTKWIQSLRFPSSLRWYTFSNLWIFRFFSLSPCSQLQLVQHRSVAEPVRRANWHRHVRAPAAAIWSNAKRLQPHRHAIAPPAPVRVACGASTPTIHLASKSVQCQC